ncbi:MAG: hypothetical protein JO326_03405 [Acetobacteraceae bacterium]|nr:hypothetical protein [Acetobacteraceae bacterium]
MNGFRQLRTLVCGIVLACAAPAVAQAGLDRNQAYLSYSGSVLTGTLSSDAVDGKSIALRGKFNLLFSSPDNVEFEIERSFNNGQDWARSTEWSTTAGAGLRSGEWDETEAGILYRVRAIAASNAILTFSAQPAAGSSVAVDYINFGFVTGTPSGHQVQIGASLSATLTNLAAAIASYDTGTIGSPRLAAAASATTVTITSGTGTASLWHSATASTSPASNATPSLSFAPTTYRLSQ